MYTRKASFAGSFYPGNKAQLDREISSYLAGASPSVNGDIVAVVSPHAGYMYSGQVAGWAYKAVSGLPFDRVVVLAPSHRGRFDGFIIPPSGSYETPLGVMKLDDEVCAKLSASPRAAFHEGIDAAEHSLEVQIPFLQKIKPEALLVPLIISTSSFEICETIASDIFEAVNDGVKTLIVISTDLSHYHQYDKASVIDNELIRVLSSFDPSALSLCLSGGKAEACGEAPLITGMLAAQRMGAVRTNILSYANSGDTAGDKDRVVGYLAAAFVR